MMTMDRRQFVRSTAALGTCAMVAVSVDALAAPARRAGYFDWKLYPPAAGGLSQTGLDGMRAAIQKNIDAKVISGAVTAVARHNKLVWFEPQGWADIENRKPMKKDSLFRMMSSTKVITTVAALMMVEEGKLALEDPVSKFIPSFHNQKVAIMSAGTAEQPKLQLVPANRDITVEDLLTHTSGLSSAGSLPAVSSLRQKLGWYPKGSLSTLIPQLGSLPLDFQPGTRFRYSPTDGMDTVLYLVELVSGVPAARFLRERLFSPLDMKNSFFDTPAEKRDRLVKLYSAKDGKLTPVAPVADLGPSNYISGSGGLTSCAHDMLNFELMLLNKGSFNGHRMLKPETVELMTRDHAGALFREWFPALTAGNDFGLGVRILKDESKSDGRAVGAFGWGGAYGTETWADPKLDLAAVMLVQMAEGSSGVRVDFTRALRKAIVA